MNILLVTNNLYPTGGDWTYVSSVAKLYQSHGHNVLLFGKQNEKNCDHKYDSYYVRGITQDDKKNKLLFFIKVLSNSIYSREAYQKIGTFIDTFSIDIVQLNSINIGLTPSIINAIKERHIPIVWRILDYKPICPTIYLRYKNELCEACRGGKYWNCVKRRCKNDSLIDSTAVAIESFFYSKRKEYSKVDVFSFQNNFMRLKYIEWGIEEGKTITIENPYDTSSIEPSYKLGGYVLYFGRLDKPKGVLTLLESAKQNHDIPYVIVGKGDEEEIIKKEIEQNEITNVDFRGPVWGEQMEQIIENAKFVVVPSEWYEPSPYVVLQAFSHAKPVIATRLGGLPEMITDGEDGLLFESRNVYDLAFKIKSLYEDNNKVIEMGINARKKVESKYSPEIYYERTIKLFNDLINNKK